MIGALARLSSRGLRQLRWWSGSWSKSRDRTYHEQLYEAQDYDPFSPGYPGYLTIRRFADHAEVLMPAQGTVLDVGCGPGEITCELARRHRHLSFVGIDHSSQAVRRGREHATRLGLANIRFDVGDAEGLPPAETYGLVTMFDAFHHLERPRSFLSWLSAHTTRCILIEPAGTSTGRWARGIEADWLLFDLANIRDRLEAICGVAHQDHPDESAGVAPTQGEGAVERRYALEDFERFFEGWHLRVTGTLAGFDRYPPNPHATSALRPVTGDLAYELLRATEDLLVRSGRDGAAKHWVIAATTEPGILQPRVPDLRAVVLSEPSPSTVASAFDVRYGSYEGPESVKAGTEFRAIVEITNTGWDEWRSDGEHPVHVSYHWLTPAGEMVEFDGLRSDLPRPVKPAEMCRVFVSVRAPSEAGTYMLAVDLVKEGVTWFSQAGMPWHSARVVVAKR